MLSSGERNGDGRKLRLIVARAKGKIRTRFQELKAQQPLYVGARLTSTSTAVHRVDHTFTTARKSKTKGKKLFMASF